MPEPENPNGQTQPGNDQTDYKAEYLKLSAQIANGDYVAKNVYTGLQQTHEKSVLSHKADKDTLTAAQAKLSDLETTLKTLTDQSAEYRSNWEKATGELTEVQTKLSRTDLILKQFPQLAEFEANGLLPQASLEELPAKLQIFTEKLGAQKTAGRQEHVQGATAQPASVNSNQAPTSKQILDEANALVRQGKFAEYNAKMDEYHKAVAAAR